jgi:uncharacterized membrane protein (UPF0127 family)
MSIFLVFVALVVGIFFLVTREEAPPTSPNSAFEAVAVVTKDIRDTTEISPTTTQPTAISLDTRPLREESSWGRVVEILIGGVAMRASIAETRAERLQGLSGTTILPLDMVKFFIFPNDGPHPIWMKDMRYPLDIIWLDAQGVVVHYEEVVDPATYPQTFQSPIPARYVVEANAGFIATHGLGLGATSSIPRSERGESLR